MNPIDAVTSALADLGPSLDSAFRTLHERGTKGQPGSATHCVLAEYLNSRGGCGSVAISPISGVVRIYRVNDFVASVDMPKHLIELAMRFDEGDYPELEVDPDCEYR